MTASLTIDVCVITYQRPGQLATLLASLSDISLEPDWEVRLIVIDNDSNRSSKQVVNSYVEKSKFRVFYIVEPARGISEARNRALSAVTGQYLCFVDDDEQVSREWLKNLVNTLINYDADIVFGPVQRIMNGNEPEWMLANNIYARVKKPTGSLVEYGATNNVLIKVSALGKPPELFDLEYSQTGGGDAEFFYRLHRMGRKLVWCDEALTTEYLVDTRATIKWFLLRRFRNGQAHFRVVIKKENPEFRRKFLLKKFVNVSISFLKLPYLVFSDYNRFVFMLGEISLGTGLLIAALPFNLYYKEYKKPK